MVGYIVRVTQLIILGAIVVVKKQATKSSVIREILASHPKAAVKEIQAELTKRRVKASVALISKIKYGRPTTRRKSRRGGSKAEAIRGMWSTLGADARPRDVIDSLAKRRSEGLVRTGQYAAPQKRHGAISDVHLS